MQRSGERREVRPDGGVGPAGVALGEAREELGGDLAEVEHRLAALAAGAEGQHAARDDLPGRSLEEEEALEVEDLEEEREREADTEEEVGGDEDRPCVAVVRHRLAAVREEDVADVGAGGGADDRRDDGEEERGGGALDEVLLRRHGERAGWRWR